jgi:hypothetical protein
MAERTLAAPAAVVVVCDTLGIGVDCASAVSKRSLVVQKLPWLWSRI